MYGKIIFVTSSFRCEMSFSWFSFAHVLSKVMYSLELQCWVTIDDSLEQAGPYQVILKDWEFAEERNLDGEFRTDFEIALFHWLFFPIHTELDKSNFVSIFNLNFNKRFLCAYHLIFSFCKHDRISKPTQFFILLKLVFLPMQGQKKHLFRRKSSPIKTCFFHHKNKVNICAI